jgi:hypothetical protein
MKHTGLAGVFSTEESRMPTVVSLSEIMAITASVIDRALGNSP